MIRQTYLFNFQVQCKPRASEDDPDRPTAAAKWLV